MINSSPLSSKRVVDLFDLAIPTASQREIYWNRAIKRSGLPPRPPYSARHTRASRMLMAGCNPARCAKQLGHTLEMFFTIYAEWIDEDDGGRELLKVDDPGLFGP